MLDKETAQFIASNLRARKSVLEAGGNVDVLTKLDRAIGLMDEIANGNTIESGWSIEDVLSLTDDEDYEFTYKDGEIVPPSDITVDQARRVLVAVDHNHDANYGINWDTLREWLDMIREEDNEATA